MYFKSFMMPNSSDRQTSKGRGRGSSLDNLLPCIKKKKNLFKSLIKDFYPMIGRTKVVFRFYEKLIGFVYCLILK